MRMYDLLLRIRRERLVRYPRIFVYRTRTYFGVSKALVAIIGTEACRWYRYGGCTMCPYPQYKPKEINVERDLKLVLRRLESERPQALMLYSSGSVLDEREVPFKLLKEFLSKIPESVKEVFIETRPEFVDDRLVELDTHAHIMPAIGLETSNDVVRLYHIRKGFLRKDFLKALEIAKKYAFGVKAYVLLKPPMMLEFEAYEDAKRTLKDVDKDGVRVVSVNPVHADPGTLQYYLLKRGLRKPPSMLTLFKLLSENFGRRYVLISEPLKAGKPEGIRPRKDIKEELRRLKEAVRNQDPRPIEEYLAEKQDSA